MLVDLPNWVGDQMMAMPALSRLIEANCGGETVLHTRPPMVRFLAAIFPGVVVVASPRKTSPVASVRTVCGGDGRFEVGVSLRNAARAKILVRMAARWGVGSRGEGAFLLLSRSCGIDGNRHQIHDADPILAALELEAADPTWCPALPATLKVEGDTALRAVGVRADRAIGLAPATARGESKRWPVERFGELADRLRAGGYDPVAVIGPGETGLANRLRNASGFDLPVVGEDQDVAGLVAVVANLRMLAGNDSGPMQTAARFGTPVVAVFGPSDPGRTAPLGPAHKVIHHPLECSPCSHPLCPLDHHDCLRGVSVTEVEKAAHDVLHSVPRPA